MGRGGIDGASNPQGGLFIAEPIPTTKVLLFCDTSADIMSEKTVQKSLFLHPAYLPFLVAKYVGSVRGDFIHLVARLVVVHVLDNIVAKVLDVKREFGEFAIGYLLREAQKNPHKEFLCVRS